MKRIWCIMFGCGFDTFGHCPRCRWYLGDRRHLDGGKLDWLRRIYLRSTR